VHTKAHQVMQLLRALCTQVRGDILTYRAAMARKPIKNIDLLRPAKRAAFSGFIGKRVNIYVTIFSFILF
jgi:hypothetical protein